MIPSDYKQLGSWNGPPEESSGNPFGSDYSLLGRVDQQKPSFDSTMTSSFLSQGQNHTAGTFNSWLDSQLSDGPTSSSSASPSPSPSPSFSSSSSSSVAPSAQNSKSGSDAPSVVSSERSSSSVGSDAQNEIVSISARSALLVGWSFCVIPVRVEETSVMQLIPVGVYSEQPNGVSSNGPASSPKLASSSSSAASSAVSSSETGGAGAQRISKRITNTKKGNINNQQFPGLEYFHPYFETFYPIKSEIKYLNDKDQIDNGIIQEIGRDPSGVPFVRIGEQWVEFKRLYVRDLKRGNSAMIFTKGFTKHVAAEVTELRAKSVKGGFIREYTMENSNSSDIEYKNIDGSQIYRVIPIIKNGRSRHHAGRVTSSLNIIWDKFNGINQDD